LTRVNIKIRKVIIIVLEPDSLVKLGSSASHGSG